MNWRIISTVTAATLILPLSAFALQNKPSVNHTQVEASVIAQRMDSGSFRERASERRQQLQRELNLTSEQSEKIREIHAQAKEDMQSLHNNLKEQKEEMRSLLASNANTNRLRQQHERIQVLKERFDDQRFETMLDVREVLTPEQRSQMAELMPQGGKRHGNRF